MTIDTLLTIALALGAFFSPVVVAVLTSKDRSRRLVSESRRDWVNESKKLIDAYLNSLNSYARSEANNTELKILNTISRNKNQLLMQYKPYKIDALLNTIEENGEGVLAETRLKSFESLLDRFKDKDKDDDLEYILVNYLYKTEQILEEAYKKEEIPIDEINYILEALPIIYSGVQKNEWKKISKGRSYSSNDIVIANLIHLTNRYIDKLKKDLSDGENESSTGENETSTDTKNMSRLKELGINTVLSEDETVSEYFYRVFSELDECGHFSFREYYGKRKHKYLSFDSPEGMISAKKFTSKKDKGTFYYEVNLSRSAARTILNKIINQGELK